MSVSNIQSINNYEILSKKPAKKDEKPQVTCDGERSHFATYMIGATALASVIALGVLGRNGKFGDKIKKMLGGKSENVSENLLNTKQKAENALESLYDKVIQKANQDGNAKKANIFMQCKNNVKNLDAKTTYGNLLDALYKDLRLGEYPASDIITPNIDKITSRSTKFIKVQNQNGWHYRIPFCRHRVKSVDRISVNALADKNLIKELDDLFASGKVKGYYKTPETAIDWLERHDPITIYLDEKATPEVLDRVKNVCEKYIRSKEDVLSGNKFASGMALQKSPDEQDIVALLAQAKSIDEDLEKVLRIQFTDTASGKLITSAGYMDSAKKMIDLLK